MAKRAKPAWGNLRVVCIRGAGQTDDQPIERVIELGERGRGDRGCRFSDAQFDRLAAHLKVTEPTLVAEVREHLNFFRTFYLTSRLHEAATPTQAERNAALAVVKDHIGAFCAAVDALAAVRSECDRGSLALLHVHVASRPPAQIVKSAVSVARRCTTSASTTSRDGVTEASAGKPRVVAWRHRSERTQPLSSSGALLYHELAATNLRRR